jgi:DNA-binding NarL/FixJ family response regulator
MSEAALGLARQPLRVAVRAADPRRRTLLSALVDELGHLVVGAIGEASVVLTDGVAGDNSVPGLAFGTDGEGYLGKLPRDAPPAQIDAALRAVAVGLSVTVTETPLRIFDALPEDDERMLLTPREIEVLNTVSDGLTNKEIARQLGISRHTVKFHLESVMRKLGASNRAEAVSKSLRIKLLEPYHL